jgi:hypothetical protein
MESDGCLDSVWNRFWNSALSASILFVGAAMT